MRVSGQAGQMVCYHCQKPGHMRRDCPQRQGSQGFGTSQSQSVAGQERIQYVPPQHGAATKASLSFRVLHGHPTFHRQAREARVWAKADDEAHRKGHQGSRGVSRPSHRRLSQQISQLYKVRFCYLAYGLECYLILVLRIHSLLHQL